MITGGAYVAGAGKLEEEEEEIAQILNQTEQQKDNYLVELNELESDLREQDNLLADKNAKLAQVIAEKNSLQDQINNHHYPVNPTFTSTAPAQTKTESNE